MEPLEEKTQDEQQTQEPEMVEQGPGDGIESEEPEGLEATEKEPAQEDSHSTSQVASDEGSVASDEGSVEGTQSPEGKEEALMEMYEESIRRVREGEIVQGKIIQVDKEFVLVDIGYKSEGQVPIDEFVGPDGTVEAGVGDTIEIMVERWEEEDGGVRLSKEKASRVKVWDDIKKAYEADGVVQGTVSSRIKGGLSVDIGIPAFLPGSQVDLRPVRDLDQMVGNTFDFKVLKYNRKRSNVVLSRRVILEKEREAKRAETLATIHEGKVMEGVVKNITEYGVFVDLGGIDGLLHITDSPGAE